MNKNFLLLAGSLLAIALGYLVDIQPLQQQLHTLTQQMKNKISNQEQEQLLLNHLRHQLQQLNEQSQNENKKFATSFSVIDALNALTDAAIVHQLKIQSIVPQSKQNLASFIVIPIQLSAVGKYQQLVEFIKQLSLLKYFCSVQMLTLLSTENETLQLNMQLAFYQSNLGCLENKTNNKLSTYIGISHNPFSLPTNRLDQSNRYWPSKDYQLLGVITQNAQKIAMIRDPLGKISRVTRGNKIGFTPSSIIKITNNAIITTNSNDNIYRRY